ncbi:uncharacterized protein EAF01_001539 [Botrytis porri]|uniref:Uncharacterized protein n=1 Tax=Botrytis porri TaxID=87229 RepID=A0A4Z1KNH4_9HELO|nr:uncharacterized protein EAF01_001539 [Botrytis porri]KAF7912518.1 hypothetical protein EAF01_001539 [Botrytis porri]TGO87008.1 hypothetical protein BPOR_0259g00040 [Botrytis porri]
MRGIVLIRGQSYVQLLDDINIKDPEAIRRVVRQAVTLPLIDEVARQGIKGCVSGPISSLLGTSTRPPTWVEQQAANDIQKLWERGNRYQIHIKRLIQDCDVTKADFLVVKGVESARKYCIQAQEEERKTEEHRKRVQPDTNEYQDLSDKEDDQKLPQAPKNAYKPEKGNATDYLREATTPNKEQNRKRSDAGQSPTRSISAELQDFEKKENRNQITPINKPDTHGINISEKKAGKPKGTPGTRMLNSLRDHNSPAIESVKTPEKPSGRRTRNSQKSGGSSGIGSNGIIPSPQLNSPQIDSRPSQDTSNVLMKELADYNKRGATETETLDRERKDQAVKQQPEPIIDSEIDFYTPEPRITGYKRKGGHGGARSGPAREKRRSQKENDDRSSIQKSQEDQSDSAGNPIGIEDGSDIETGMHG